MKAKTPYQILERWRQQNLRTGVVLGILLIGVLGICNFSGLILIPVALASGLVGILAIGQLHQRNQPSLRDVLQLAHSQNPKLEYSGSLLVKDKELIGLSLLQKRKAEERFGTVDYQIPLDIFKIVKSILLIVSVTIGGIAIQSLLGNQEMTNAVATNIQGTVSSQNASYMDKTDTTFIKEITIHETPPAYTGLRAKGHRNLDLHVIEGSDVRWTANVEGEINNFFYKFGREDTIHLRDKWSLRKTVTRSDFYQYGYGCDHLGFTSDFHSIKVVRDQNPEVLISGIEEYVKLSWQERHIISFDIILSDDYALSEAFISATIAKGSGEAVKFREREFKLKNFTTGRKNYKGSYSFDTRQLKMEPGDELYFYVKAKDNYPSGDHWTKSTTHFISIQDTTTYEYVDGGGIQVDLMPDFFRSQRQIIIDSEKLLKNQSKISIDSFNQASNSLGYDQKMLRLKYGQFLGEENESGIAISNEIPGREENLTDPDHDHVEDEASKSLESARELLSEYMHDHDHEEEEGLIMATRGTESDRFDDPSRPTWVEELSHNHDDREVATFHNISAKSKLRAALSVMWDAELHLRLFDPATSLPYQYECLELLQEIKNHARIYVHRIGFDPPAIKEGEFRLSGDQDEIDDRTNSSVAELEDEYEVLKEIAGIMGGKLEHHVNIGLEQYLSTAIITLARLSLSRSEVLPVLTMANRINQNLSTTTPLELDSLRKQIIKILPEEAFSVHGVKTYAPEMTLSVAKKITY